MSGDEKKEESKAQKAAKGMYKTVKIFIGISNITTDLIVLAALWSFMWGHSGSYLRDLALWWDETCLTTHFGDIDDELVPTWSGCLTVEYGVSSSIGAGPCPVVQNYTLDTWLADEPETRFDCENGFVDLILSPYTSRIELDTSGIGWYVKEFSGGMYIDCEVTYDGPPVNINCEPAWYIPYICLIFIGGTFCREAVGLAYGLTYCMANPDEKKSFQVTEVSGNSLIVSLFFVFNIYRLPCFQSEVEKEDAGGCLCAGLMQLGKFPISLSSLILVAYVVAKAPAPDFLLIFSLLTSIMDPVLWCVSCKKDLDKLENDVQAKTAV